MTFPFRKGRYAARFAVSAADILACQTLRYRCFFGGIGKDEGQFDAVCKHLMIENGNGDLVCTIRLLLVNSDEGVAGCYSAQSYDLSRLRGLCAPSIELGRFCIDPTANDSDVLRIAWAAIAKMVDETGAMILFGCTSFAGTDPARYRDAFDVLRGYHLGPEHLRPGRKAVEMVEFPHADQIDKKNGLRQMPALLRSYLSMGGWVSDHAVVDRELNTLHVFTYLDVANIPAARIKALRSVMQ